MRNKIFKTLIAIAIVGMMNVSCKREPEPIPPRGDYDGGYVVLNEGQFMHDNASVSFVSEDLSEIEDSVFYKVNNELLGDVAQSAFTTDEKFYFVINNSDKIVVADRWEMDKKGIITSYIKSPRYMIRVSDRFAVVSNWGVVFDQNWQDVHDDYLAWVDLENDVVTDTLHVATGPEKMLFHGGKLYVSVPGVSASNNKVLVIDPAARTQIGEITVGDRPQAIVEADDKVWVICSGNAAWTGNETAGKLVKINPATDTVEQTFDLAQTEHPKFMVENDDYLYILAGHKLYKVSISSPVFDNSTVALDLTGTVQTPYGLQIHDDKLFVTDAVDYASPGKVYVFDLDNMNQIAELTAGYLPNNIIPNF
jgi:hypothetical protein